MYRVQTMYLPPRARASAGGRARGGYWGASSFLYARVVYICTLVKKNFLPYTRVDMATTEEKIAAHVAAGFDPFRNTTLTTAEWLALRMWTRKNPELRFRQGDLLAPGKYFRVYQQTCRSGVYCCPAEKLVEYRESKRRCITSTTAERAARKKARKARSGLHAFESRAAARGRCVSLSEQDLQDYVGAQCFFCGVLPAAGTAHGIDRLFNGHDYHYDNCVPCCRRCNLAKYTLEANEFLDLVARVARYQLKLQAQ